MAEAIGHFQIYPDNGHHVCHPYNIFSTILGPFTLLCIIQWFTMHNNSNIMLGCPVMLSLLNASTNSEESQNSVC